METDDNFNVPNKDIYPPFKRGLYLEEYFRHFHHTHDDLNEKRTYIPAMWTNFQIAPWFQERKHTMQIVLDAWIQSNHNENGYYTIVQHDDGPLLSLPSNCIVYGACTGNVYIPLIYEDIDMKLENIPRVEYDNKSILCSFVGTFTHHVRRVVYETYKNNPNFIFNVIENWSPVVDSQKQDNFITLTSQSKYALAPRGYGRSSFRFFEILKLGVVPIYIWDDLEWLPYKDEIDYSKMCVSINVNDTDKLEGILQSITPEQYNAMLCYYEMNNQLFYLDGMCSYIMKHEAKIE